MTPVEGDANDGPVESRSDATRWAPAFEGQRPPFEPGNPLVFTARNQAAVTHGAYTPRIVGPVAQALVDAVLADPEVAHLHRSAFRPAVEAWAYSEAQCRVLAAWVDRLGVEAASESDRGKTSPLELLRRFEMTAMTHRGRLGLDPLSAARLGRDVAVGRAADTARIMAELHAMEQAEQGKS